MANIKSAVKRHKQSLRRRSRNRVRKSRVKTTVKAIKLALQENNLEKAKELLPLAMKEIHRAASKGAIHRKNSARKIARLSSFVHRYETQETKD
ncbi:MAG: 30S ribosomal protein S20 [Deltaproteobacteria bacterium]|nr:30S ribosomal protein S20 [Deltaproteobacteria bacterium]NIS78170.1 30S ribosomal protein S20 [Deltaproteobacteria bacterium]